MAWAPMSGGHTMADQWGSFLSNISILDLGATGLLALTVLMILTGRLVPKSTSDAWKDAYQKEQAVTREQAKQISMLAASTSVTARVLDALPKASGGDPDETDTETVRRKS